jgi:potassium efflux system protein
MLWGADMTAEKWSSIPASYSPFPSMTCQIKARPIVQTRPTGASIVLLLAFVLAPQTSSGSPAAGAGTAPVEQKVQAIPAADIPDSADADEQFMQAVVRRSQSADLKGQRVEQTLLDLSSGVRRLAEHSNDPGLSTISLRTLSNLLRHWRFYEREISRWRVDVQRTTRASLKDATDLSSRRGVWQATRLDAADSAPALLQRVDEVLGHVDQADKILSLSLATTLDLGRRVSALLAQVESGKAGVLTMIADQDQRLLMIDSLPLWDAASGNESRKPVDVGMRESLQIEMAFARDYDAGRFKAIRVEIACGVLLLPLMLWLRHRATRVIAAGQATALSMHALLRPWAAWLVLVALGEVLFGLQGPLIRQETVILLAWIPVLRLLPPPILTRISPWAYLSAACYLMNVAASLLVGNELWYRSLLLIIDVIALASLVWLRLRARRSTPVIGQPENGGLLGFLPVVAAGVLLASIGSNVFGNVTLATMLTTAVLDSSYIGLALYAGATVVVALFRVLVLRPTVSRLDIHNAASLMKVGATVGRTLLVAAWLVFVLQFFRIFRPLLEVLIAVLSYHFKLGVLSISVGSITGFVAAVWVAFWLAKTIRLLLAEDILPSVSLPRGVGNTISTLTYYAILFLGLLVALAIAGFQIGELAIAFGALGVGIGFGLQDIVKNFVSGLILMFERPIQPGDVVDVTGASGTVREIGMRATILTTPEGAEVVVPNGMLLAEKLVNWTLRSSRRRIDVNVVTAYNADPQRTIELLVGIAGKVDGIALAPPPVAILVGLATGALEFTLRAWTTEQTDWVSARSVLNVKVRDGLAEAGIEVPLPQRDLHLRSISKAAGEQLADTTISRRHLTSAQSATENKV